MLYDVILKISYEYEYAATGGRHLLRLMPAHIEGRQHLITGYLDIKPRPNERTDNYDAFNNAVSHVVYYSDHPEISFNLKARVECLPQNSGLNMSPNLTGLRTELSSINSLAPDSPYHYLGNSPRVTINAAMTAFAYTHTNDQMDAISVVESIGMALHREMTFDPDATTVETSAEEAFEKRTGVCQDYTHIMISCLRGIGIPAGYVSGFIRTIPPEGTERLEGADAMHAWVRAWCGIENGWIEFDPTNAMFINTDHIVVAYGRDYSDIAPVKGVLKTYGEQNTTQAVDIIPVKSNGVNNL